MPTTMRLLYRLFIALLTLACKAKAQSAAPCPRDVSVEGYSSIADINTDMQNELARIGAGGAPAESYTFRFCPNMIFDASAAALQPVLSNSFFVCGNDGSRNNNCIILGGSEQIRIQDSTVDSFPLERLTFMGLTFVDFTGNDAATGTSISALANSRTTAVFMDVSFTDFASDFVIRQTTGFSPDPPMTIEISQSSVMSGTAGVVFNNDGGRITLQNVDISAVTSASIMATANTGISFLQDSTVTSSSVSSVTFTTAAGSQTVLNVEVSGMTMVEDVFLVEGSDSVLSISGTNIVRNEIEAPSTWTAIAVNSQAVATVLESSISENQGLEFAVSATLAGSVVLQDTNLRENKGADPLNATSALVFGISDTSIFLQDTKFTDNEDFTAVGIALLRSTLDIAKSCIEGGGAEFVISIDETSNFVASSNYIANFVSERCEIAPRLFKEAEGSGCFVGSGRCEGECLVVADQMVCLAQVEPTMPPTTSEPESPTGSPSTPPSQQPSTVKPTMTQSSPPSSSPSSLPPEESQSPSKAPSVFPSILPTPPGSDMPTQSPFPGMSTSPTKDPESNAPSSAPSTPAPTQSPSMTPQPTVSMAPSAGPTVSVAPTTSTQPSSIPTSLPSVLPTAVQMPTLSPTRPEKEKPSGKKGNSSKKNGKKDNSSKSSKSGKKRKKGKKKTGNGKGKGKGGSSKASSDGSSSKGGGKGKGKGGSLKDSSDDSSSTFSKGRIRHLEESHDFPHPRRRLSGSYARNLIGQRRWRTFLRNPQEEGGILS